MCVARLHDVCFVSAVKVNIKSSWMELNDDWFQLQSVIHIKVCGCGLSHSDAFVVANSSLEVGFINYLATAYLKNCLV